MDDKSGEWVEYDDIGVGNYRPVVGHLPRELSKVLWYFLVNGAVLECEVTGSRQRFSLVATRRIGDTMHRDTSWKKDNCGQGRKTFIENSYLLMPRKDSSSTSTAPSIIQNI